MGGDRATGRNRAIRRKIEMDDDRLIELVRRNPSLYRMDSEQPKNNSGRSVSRASIWIAIGAELKRHPLFCKKRWGNIRDNFKKAMKKYNWRLAQGHTSVKKYKFFEQLSFLEKQFIFDDKQPPTDDDEEDDKPESSHGTSLEVKCEPDIDPEYDDINLYANYNQNHRFYDDYLEQPASKFELNNYHNEEEDTTEMESRLSIGEEELNEPDSNGINERQRQNNEEQEEAEEENDDHRISSPKIEPYLNGTHLGLRKAKKRKRGGADDSPATTAANSITANEKTMRYFGETGEADRYAERQHPVDAFLAGIAPTLKSLSPYYLSLAKTNIYSIVQEYEMAMIMQERNGGSHRN